MAAISGLLLRRWIRISLGPVAGPMLSMKAPRISTARAPLPARQEPNQSSSRSSVRRITGAGMDSKVSVAANSARAWVEGVGVVMGCR